MRGYGQDVCAQNEDITLDICFLVFGGFKMKSVYALDQLQRDGSIHETVFSVQNKMPPF